MHGNKGQYFLITSLLLVIYFSAVVHFAFNSSQALQHRKNLEYLVWKNTFEQIKNEEKTLFEYFCNNDSFVEIAKNYTIWVRNRMAVSNAGLRVVFLFANKSASGLSVKLVNLAGEQITNINITYNNTSKTITSLDDGKEWDLTFNGEDNKILVSYEEAGKTNNYIVNLETKTSFWVMSLDAPSYRIKDGLLVRE